MISNLNSNPYPYLGQALRLNQYELNQSMLRLTTGLRVNRASDDPGSYFLAKRLSMRADATQAAANYLKENLEALRSTEDVLVEIKSLLEEMRDLAEDAAAESNAAVRGTYAAEYDELKSQIDTLVTTSNFDGDNLLNGDNTFTVQVDEDATDTLDYTTLDSVFASATGLNLGDIGMGDDYSGAAGVWDDGAVDAVDMAAAQRYADSIDEGVRGDDASEASGLSRINRNINRIANTITLLEGRQTYLLNKISNYQAVESAITGVDQAEEVSRFTSLQIKQQAGAYFLAQANSQNNFVANLIMGISSK